MSDSEFDTVFDDGLQDEDFLKALDHASSSASGPTVSPPAFRAVNRQPLKEAQPLAADTPAGLADIPSDAFDSSSSEKQSANSRLEPQARSKHGLSRTASGQFRQTTLWGQELTADKVQSSQQQRQARSYRVDLREDPSHHELDREAMQTWVYPTNLGAIRDYQFSIVKNSLFNNTLVALPTGLGKTFIAATVMLNFYRWTRTAKIVFVAPTKPLVAQQVDACYNIVGIPRSETTLLTGDIAPGLRVGEWESKRVFFMTPQTLMNDLSHGYADPKSIVLLVIDEAHRSTGEYAYAKVTKLIRRFSKSIRVLALTATPGSKVETVQEVIDNLGISHCDIRTEESLDIRQYVHDRNIDQIILEPSDEIQLVSELFTEALKPLTEKLSSQNIWYGRNPMALTTFGLLQQQKDWLTTRGRHANPGLQHMMRAIFTVLTSIAHSIKLLQFHGIKPFYDNMKDFRDEQENKGNKGSKYKRQIIESNQFQEMMDKIGMWSRNPDFVGHPKLTALGETVLNHFVDHGESTRVIVFCEYRDSAEEIVRMLNKHRPLLKASIFVGQADSKRAEGMKQVQQIETIDRFRKGDFNVLVATSIGEEGLDIGQVDLIVCYDSSASPIRMLQRMGRTGRKRAGHIVLLLMRGKEEDQFAKSKDNYEKMQRLICEGSRFNFRFDISTRIVPREIRPEVDKRHVEIPVENTQDKSLPEPRKRKGPTKKKPPKKFHMPDGVETGFQKLSDMLGKSKANTGRSSKATYSELDELAPIPDLKDVLLNEEELKELDRFYRDLPFNQNAVEETDMPSMTAFSELQRQLRPFSHIRHGRQTHNFVELMRKMGEDDESLGRPQRSGYDYEDIPLPSFVNTDGEVSDDGRSAKKGKPPSTVIVSLDKPTIPGALPQPMKRKRATVSSKAKNRTLEDSEDENASGDEAAAAVLPKKRGRPKGTTKKKGKQKGSRSLEADLGDDCERDSDMLESDGSDDGADLFDFIAADDSSLREPSSTLESLLDDSTPRATRKQSPYYEPTMFPSTQDSEDLPDVGKLSGGAQGRNHNSPRLGSKRRRKVVSDTDSDDPC